MKSVLLKKKKTKKVSLYNVYILSNYEVFPIQVSKQFNEPCLLLSLAGNEYYDDEEDDKDEEEEEGEEE